MVIYIKELDKNDKLKSIEKYPKVIRKFIMIFVEITNSFFIEYIDEENKKYIIPNINEKKVYCKIRKKISKEQKKTKRKVEIVLSEKMHELLKNFEGLRIINGRKIYLDYIEDIIENVLGENPMELQDVYILANSYNYTNVNIINRLSGKVKSVNIVTNDIKNYSILENMLYEKGIIITISNNKKKSLKKAKLIINLDFDGDILRRYNIFSNACIINMKETVIKNLQCFEGMIVNNIDIKLPKEQSKFLKVSNLISNFRSVELFESLKLNEKNIDIISLYGNNGIISEKERLNVQKILTN